MESHKGRLSKKLVAEVKSYLDEGRLLPDDLKTSLFENKREYELTYAGKTRIADIVADTMAVPFQEVKTFGNRADPWANMLIFGDNLQVLKSLLEMKDAGDLRNADGTKGVRLCYIDPPFATRREFLGTKHERAYQDKVVGSEFIEFLRKRLVLIHDLLSDDGSLYVHLDEKKSHYVKVVLDEIFGENRFEREIIWRIGWVSGYKTAAPNWIRNHDTILFYRRGATKVFNKEYLPYPENYLRRDGNAPTGVGFPIEDTWNSNVADRLDSIQIMSFSGEKTGYPTQKNENLLDRIIKTSSNPGDLVLDAFLGSGTTAVVAEKRGRRWIGIESGKLAIYVSQDRLLKLGADGRSTVPVSPFTLYNAGLYDFKTLKALPWVEFRLFSLRLFQCRDEPHTVAGVYLDGFIGLDDVLVFNFQAHKSAALDEAFVDDLHKAIGHRIGRRFFIVAPAASVRFLQDFIELPAPNHPVRYYILRIPYSVIEEMHRHGFTRLQQPISESSVNDTVDAFGFDFVRPPYVESEYTLTKSQVKVAIRNFGLEAMVRNGEGPMGLDGLALLMVDNAYDGTVFRVAHVFYAEDLRGTDWSFALDRSTVGDQIMLIFVDVSGNEYREVKRLRDLKVSASK